MTLLSSKNFTTCDTRRDGIETALCRLLVALEECLCSEYASWSEVDLIKHLQRSHAFFSDLNFADPVSLYQTHFLLFHALYRLRTKLERSRGLSVNIHTLDIHCHPFHSLASKLPKINDPLALFYGDITHLGMTADEINDMLNHAWRRIVPLDKTAEALALLDLDSDATTSDIKKQYRRLSLRHHPDRGGDAITFQRIDQAYRLVKRAYAFN